MVTVQAGIDQVDRQEMADVAAQPTKSSDALASQVVNAAKHAWEVHGEPIEVAATPVNGHAHLASLAAFHARRVEYVVEADDPDVWKLLAATAPADRWQRCALVPLPLMGRAHELLSEYGFELQGWWMQDDRVAFGGVEIA